MARGVFHVKPRDQQGRRCAERSGSSWQPGMRADRSEGMKGIAGSLIDRTRGRSEWMLQIPEAMGVELVRQAS